MALKMERGMAAADRAAGPEPVQKERRRLADFGRPPQLREPRAERAGLVEDLDDLELAPVVQSPRERRSRALRQSTAVEVGSWRESTRKKRPRGRSARRTSAQKASKSSGGTWESQKPKNTTSNAAAGGSQVNRSAST